MRGNNDNVKSDHIEQQQHDDSSGSAQALRGLIVASVRLSYCYRKLLQLGRVKEIGPHSSSYTPRNDVLQSGTLLRFTVK